MALKNCVLVYFRHAEKAKEFLKLHGLLDFKSLPLKSENEIFFALSKRLSAKEKNALKKIAPEFVSARKKFAEAGNQPRSLREALEERLSKKEMRELIASYDIIGSIAVIEIPEELEKKSRVIGEALLSVNKSIKTACRISGAHSGEFRVQPVEVIAGEKTTETIYKEHGCKFKVDLSKVFFSPRLSTERLRIAKQIKSGEKAAVFFAGAGPFAVVFAKHSPAQKIYAVELNPDAVRLMRENIELNHVEGKIIPLLGDVRKVKLPEKVDRIAMPLPRGGEAFLDSAFEAAAENCVIHFYQFEQKKDPFSAPLKRIKDAAEKAGRKTRILRKAIVRSFSPSTVQVVIDFKVGKTI